MEGDRKKYKFHKPFSENPDFTEYRMTSHFSFYSYSVEGLLFDLDSIIFAESGYIPWTEKTGIKLKYEKRIIRYAALLICAVYSTTEQARTLLGNFIEQIKALRENPERAISHDQAPPNHVISHALLNFMKVVHTMHTPAHAAERSQNLRAWRAFTGTSIENFDGVLQLYPSTLTVSRLKLTKMQADLKSTDLNIQDDEQYPIQSDNSWCDDNDAEEWISHFAALRL